MKVRVPSGNRRHPSPPSAPPLPIAHPPAPDSDSPSAATRSASLASTRRRFAGPLLLVLVCAVTAGLNLLLLALDQLPQHWDSSHHLMHAIGYADRIAAAGLSELPEIWTTEYRFYPPAFRLATAPAFLLLRHSLEAGLAWQTLFLVLTLVVLYRLVAHDYGPLYGALAATAYASFPIVLGFSRMAFTENLLALEVVLVVWLAMPLRALERPLLAAVLGFVVGCGQMTKWQFVFYVGPLLGLVFVSGLVEARRIPAPGRSGAVARRLLCPALAGLVALALAAPWYSLHFEELLVDLRFHAFEREMGDAPLLSARALLYYVQVLPWQMIGVPLTLLLFGAIGSGILRRRAEPRRFVWVLAVFACAVLLTFSKHKEGRFLLPMLPLFTAILVGGIATARMGIRIASVALVLLVSPLNAAAQTFSLAPAIDSVTVPIGLGRRGYIVRAGTPEWYLWPIRRENWAWGEIFEEIEAISAANGVVAPRIHFCMEEDHPYFNPVGCWSRILARRLVDAVGHDDAAFCISHGKGPAERGGRRSDTAFVPVRSWELPDGTAVRLFRRP